MSRDELGVEQDEAAISQSRHEIDERDLARITRLREHALAEEGATEMDAVESADKPSLLPDLDRMAMAERE
jgi:hypothetical protein